MIVRKRKWNGRIRACASCGGEFFRGAVMVTAGSSALCWPCGAPLWRKAQADATTLAETRRDAVRAGKATREPRGN